MSGPLSAANITMRPVAGDGHPSTLFHLARPGLPASHSRSPGRAQLSSHSGPHAGFSCSIAAQLTPPTGYTVISPPSTPRSRPSFAMGRLRLADGDTHEAHSVQDESESLNGEWQPYVADRYVRATIPRADLEAALEGGDYVIIEEEVLEELSVEEPGQNPNVIRRIRRKVLKNRSRSTINSVGSCWDSESTTSFSSRRLESPSEATSKRSEKTSNNNKGDSAHSGLLYAGGQGLTNRTTGGLMKHHTSSGSQWGPHEDCPDSQECQKHLDTPRRSLSSVGSGYREKKNFLDNNKGKQEIPEKNIWLENQDSSGKISGIEKIGMSSFLGTTGNMNTAINVGSSGIMGDTGKKVNSANTDGSRHMCDSGKIEDYIHTEERGNLSAPNNVHLPCNIEDQGNMSSLNNMLAVFSIDDKGDVHGLGNVDNPGNMGGRNNMDSRRNMNDRGKMNCPRKNGDPDNLSDAGTLGNPNNIGLGGMGSPMKMSNASNMGAPGNMDGPGNISGSGNMGSNCNMSGRVKTDGSINTEGPGNLYDSEHMGESENTDSLGKWNISREWEHTGSFNVLEKRDGSENGERGTTESGSATGSNQGSRHGLHKNCFASGGIGVCSDGYGKNNSENLPPLRSSDRLCGFNGADTSTTGKGRIANAENFHPGTKANGTCEPLIARPPTPTRNADEDEDGSNPYDFEVKSEGHEIDSMCNVDNEEDGFVCWERPQDLCGEEIPLHPSPPPSPTSGSTESNYRRRFYDPYQLDRHAVWYGDKYKWMTGVPLPAWVMELRLSDEAAFTDCMEHFQAFGRWPSDAELGPCPTAIPAAGGGFMHNPAAPLPSYIRLTRDRNTLNQYFTHFKIFGRWPRIA